MKKLASLLLVFALALSLAVPCFAANEKEIIPERAKESKAKK